MCFWSTGCYDGTPFAIVCKTFAVFVCAIAYPLCLLCAPAVLGRARAICRPSNVSQNRIEIAVIDCLQSLAAALIHRRKRLRKLECYSLPGRQASPGDSSPQISVVSFCRVLFVHLEKSLSNLNKCGPSICLARALANLLPSALDLKRLKKQHPALWQHKCSVVRECIGLLAESLNVHLRRRFSSVLVVNLLDLNLETIDRCIAVEDAANFASTPVAELLPRLLLNEYLISSRPRVREMLLPLVPALNPGLNAQLLRLGQMRKAMTHIISFHALGQQVVAQLQTAPLVVVQMLLRHAELGMETLNYTKDVKFVDFAVDVCLVADVIGADAPEDLKAASTKVMMLLLSFPLDVIRVCTYKRIAQRLVDDTTTTAVSRVATNASIVFQVVLGLDDQIPEIANIARWLILRVTTAGELGVPFTPATAQAIVSVMPVLQAHAADNLIGRRVKELAADIVIDPRQDASTSLLTATRALYHKDASVRQWGRDKLVRHKLLALCPRFHEDLLFVDLDDALEVRSRGWSDHSADETRALVDVLCNQSVNINLRVSAAEHLSLILASGQHHDLLYQMDLFTYAFQAFSACYSIDGTGGLIVPQEQSSGHNTHLTLSRACLGIMRLLLQSQAELRHDLLRDANLAVFVSVLSFAIYVRTLKEQDRWAVAAMLGVLIFDGRLTLPTHIDGVVIEANQKYENELEQPDGSFSLGHGGARGMCLSFAMKNMMAIPHHNECYNMVTFRQAPSMAPACVETHVNAVSAIWCLLKFKGIDNMLRWREDQLVNCDVHCVPFNNISCSCSMCPHAMHLNSEICACPCGDKDSVCAAFAVLVSVVLCLV